VYYDDASMNAPLDPSHPPSEIHRAEICLMAKGYPMNRRIAVVVTAALVGVAACSDAGGRDGRAGQLRTGRPSDLASAIARSDRRGPLPDTNKAVMVVLRPGRSWPAMQKYLTGKGIRIASSDPGTGTTSAQGAVRALEAAFGVHLYRWRDRITGEDFSANDKQMVLPERMASGVVAVPGLYDCAREPHRPLRHLRRGPSIATSIRRGLECR
jgi:hypothetical protein